MSKFFVKNVSNKPIAFDELVLLPDEIAALPEGYGNEHPVVRFYLKQKFLERVDPKAATAQQRKAAAAAAEAAKAKVEAAEAKAAEAAAVAKAAAEAAAAAENGTEEVTNA